MVDACPCGRSLKQPTTGRRRVRCEVCSPPDKRDRRVATIPAPVAVPTYTEGDLVTATRAELVAAERETTSAGVEALALARMIDAGGYTAQGAAALAKARREAMTAALAGARVADDAADELARRRFNKATSA